VPPGPKAARLGTIRTDVRPLDSSFVAIDIETTGLDPERDAVTEVGLVRFDASGQEVESFQSFVNPGREIPLFVQQLTGVTTRDVESAPTLKALRSRILAFVGDDTIVGHNIQFDRSYLRKGGVNFPGAGLDTAELSRLLLPARRTHNLADLACELGVQLDEHHRALADARAAGHVFLALRERARQLAPAQRSQLSRLISLHDPELASVIGPVEADGIVEATGPALLPARTYPRLEPREPAIHVPEVELDGAFAAAARVIAGFEQRLQQRTMAETVRQATNDGGHVLVEAGTGVGKSLAYLLPSALYAVRNGRRVVVSTNTISLQEQLLSKDIPALREVLLDAGVIDAPEDFRAVLLKGRANYLCLQRWFASYGAGMADSDFARLAASMLLWLPETETGDRSELGLDHTNWLTWQRISAQDADCLSRQNRFVREGSCFLHRARRAAESAHIIVVNHALLLADLASGRSAIPPFDTLIIDEAHNLEDVATRQFGGSVPRRMLTDALEAVHRPGSRDQRAGGVAEFLKAAPGTGAAKVSGESLERMVSRTHERVGPFFDALAGFLPAKGEEDRLLLSGAIRSSPDWSVVEESAASLDEFLRLTAAEANNAARTLGGQGDDESPNALADEVESAGRRLDELRLQLRQLLAASGNDTIVWLSRERDGSASLNSAPLDVGPALREQLFDDCRTLIATSATLATGRDAKYTARRLGLEDAEFSQLGSPFDYQQSTLLAAVTDIPEPGDRDYVPQMTTAIAELVRASNGRALALFTSHAALRRVAEALRPQLEADGIAVLAQGIDGPPPRLIQNLIEQPRSVVLGTASFWEGVDVKGEALSLLIIGRLPFAVPTDPVYKARSEQYDNPFAEYALPSAILRFRQGFGRLIRDHSDRGVVAVLDRRILSKGYGRSFVEALPTCTMLKADAASIADRTREWLAQ
jgi:Rad3-related DNA helicase/DNA polymerase III epsilon subunit-like protein